jgi:hypothetical protein
MSTTIFLTSGTSWTVPANWNSSVNTIEVIGGGGAGGTNGNAYSGGGGGGAYSKISNLTLIPEASVTYQVGTGGGSGTNGGDTWFNGASLGASSVGAKGGTFSPAGTGHGSGGSSASGIGTIVYSGGDGGAGNGYGSGGGGGGAAGKNGAGGGGTNGGGNPGPGGGGGQGDNGNGGTGGSSGGGAGGNGTEYTASYGSGGGGGGGSVTGTHNGGAGGTYGAGGGGIGNGGNPGSGYQGLIVITYTGNYNLSVTVGSFALTGEITSFIRTHIASLGFGSFHLTGINIGFIFDGHYIFSILTGYFTLTGYDATFSTGFVPLLAGIFSLVVSPSMLGESASGLVMEAQNSYGLEPSGGSLSNGILIDNSPSANGNDSYYSAWSNGTLVGGIDYNDITLWGNYEPLIETDIIPMGSILDKRSLGQIMFKLDRPMSTGDLISLYARGSLTDSYTLIGTTSTNQLSENFPSNLSQLQWIQFMIKFACASSGSSRIPFRELRIQMK